MVERHETDLLPAFLSYYERFEGYGFWAALEKPTRRFLGWFHFRPGEGAGPFEPELAYRLHRFAWNRGYATEGSQALIRKGFTELGVERVTAHAMAVNVASRRVMEKAGLRLVRTFHANWPVRIPGDEHGDVEYALDRGQCEADADASWLNLQECDRTRPYLPIGPRVHYAIRAITRAQIDVDTVTPDRYGRSRGDVSRLADRARGQHRRGLFRGQTNQTAAPAASHAHRVSD